MSKNNSAKGYTLVEILLVLAIAGLLLALIIFTLGRAQQSRRDDQRRADVSRFMVAARQYTNNHDGNYPTLITNSAAANQAKIDEVINNYLLGSGGNFSDPSTKAPYVVTYNISAPTAVGQISVSDETTCSGDPATHPGGYWHKPPTPFSGATILENSGASQSFAAAIYLESGEVFCANF